MAENIEVVKVKKPDDVNIIIGQSHFIKTVEDLYEALISSVPGLKFAVAFCEASGACRIRSEATDEELRNIAIENAQALACGHAFIVLLKDAFPINVLAAIKAVPEVCSIYCATANSLEVIVIKTALGRGILGVVDGSLPRGPEGPEDVQWRKDFLRQIGYKL